MVLHFTEKTIILPLLLVMVLSSVLPSALAAHGAGGASKQITKIELFIPKDTIELGNNVTILATLREDNGRLLEDETLVLMIEGVETGQGKTDRNGQTEFTYKPSSGGTLQVRVVFGETADHRASNSTTRTLTVKTPQQQVVTQPNTPQQGVQGSNLINPLVYLVIALAVVIAVGIVVMRARNKPSAK